MNDIGLADPAGLLFQTGTFFHIYISLFISFSTTSAHDNTRKRLFELQLWYPVHAEHANSGVHHDLLSSLPKSHYVQAKDTNLQLAMVNVASIRNKVDDFVHHVTSHGYDVCVITETWLRHEDPQDAHIISQLKTSDFDFFHSPRQSHNRGGGIGVLYRNKIKLLLKIKSRRHLNIVCVSWIYKMIALS